MSFNYNISLSGILTNQRQMQVSQNNIANAETEGYARQRLHVEASSTALGGGGVGLEIGSGVIGKYVERLKDEMLIEQARNEKSEIGYHDEIARLLSDVEVVVGEGKDSAISKVMSKFFNAWDELSKFPEESSYRLTLLGEAERFANRISSVSNQMEDLKSQMKDEVNDTMEHINRLTVNIANVNKQINEQTTDRPNALLDQRDRFLDELSGLIDVKMEVDLKNPKMINVKSGGIFLVSGGEQNMIRKMEDEANGERVFIANGVVLKPEGGKFAAQVELQERYIPSYIDSLNEWVGVLTAEMNTAHAAGFGLDNTTGIAFFSGTTAGSIKVNEALFKDPEKIAVSASINTPGNNDNGKQISDIRDKQLFNGNTMSLENFYKGIIMNMATDLNVAEDNIIVHESVLTGIETQKQSLQGVNIDEEMTNLLQYQQIYTANAKMIKAISDTFDQLFAAVN